MSAFAVVCSGQGAQSPELFSQFPFTARGLAMKERLQKSLEPEAAAWLDDPKKNPEVLFQNRFSQPLLCLYQAMIWAEMEPLLPPPAMVTGYSLGELSAYGCAGALTPEDVVRLATLRARLMDAAGPRGELIAVTGLSPKTVEKCADAHLAIVIGDDHFVVGCLAGRAESLAGEFRAGGANCATLLAMTVASHTPLLDAAVEPFRAALQSTDWCPPGVPILAGINAAKVMRREQMEHTLPEQIHCTIRWDHVQQRFLESGCRVLLELGPGRQLSHMAAARGLEARAVEEFRSPEGVAAWVESTLQRLG
ncbi:MAG: acyltransferase domain-containing protein [Chthoniobacterales bacterium]|nr:acyltransferase domain-containing protein [Chthoniobacterales bacterium]